jgi:hypothetical protein
MKKQKTIGTVLIAVALIVLAIFVISAFSSDTGEGGIFPQQWKTECRVEVYNEFIPIIDVSSTIRNIQCTRQLTTFCSDISPFSIWGGEGGTLIMEVRDSFGRTSRQERNWYCGQGELCTFTISKCTEETPMTVDMTLRHENGRVLSQEQRRLE